MKTYKRELCGWTIMCVTLLLIVISLIALSHGKEIHKLNKQNNEILQANQHLKAENTFLQKERDWNKSDKRLLRETKNYISVF